MRGEERQELGRPDWFLSLCALVLSTTKGVQVGRTETTSREADDRRESDQPIVLGDGRAVHMGKGLTGIRSLQRKHSPDMKGWIMNANLPAGNSKDDLLVIMRQ